MAGTELSVHELKPQVHLDKIFLFSKLLSMHGIVYRLHFYIATML